MKITRIEATPLRIPFRTPYHWALGVLDAADTLFIEIHTDEGLVGYGEAMASASPALTAGLIAAAAKIAVGRDTLQINALLAELHLRLFAARGNLAGTRFGATILAGIDMALWDLSGKAAARPVYALLGGARRDHIDYFSFPQGDTPEEIARDAALWAERGCEVFYVKVGRGDALDREIVRQVRSAIGDRRLRVDANAAWDVLTARRMIQALAAFDIEFVEQPTASASIPALREVRRHSPIPIAADQIVYSPEDVLHLCQAEAADLIVLGLHETGGITRFLNCAAVAETAGLNICLHGLYETGITTCASLHAGMVIANLDDGNQIMNHLLAEDIVHASGLALEQGRPARLDGPGLGFDIDWDAVGRARERAART